MTAAFLVRGDARRIPLMDRSVQCIVTSPPFWNLRNYGGQVSLWGGDPLCDHDFQDLPTARAQTGGTGPASVKQGTHKGNDGTGFVVTTAICWRCSCWRGELGSENDVGSFIRHLVEVLAECKRVLRDDGVCMVNIADSYCGSGKGGQYGPNSTLGNQRAGIQPADKQGFANRTSAGRPKSLSLVPERLAIALSDDGWIVRSRIAWCKAAPMPESAKDRPTSAWEHIWQLTKQGRYFWDGPAVAEPAAHDGRIVKPYAADARVHEIGDDTNDLRTATGFARGMAVGPTRNLWNYWVLPPDPYPGAHFATFPREIPRRCILAATSEYGACAACGAAWARTTERTRTPRPTSGPHRGGRGRSWVENGIHGTGGTIDVPMISTSTTTGWTASCTCGPAAGVRPCVVLDPFSGSGTSAFVAAQLGRTGIGVELSEEYTRQARYGRLAQDFLPFGAPA